MTNAWTTRSARSDDALTIAEHRYYRGEPQDDLATYAAWARSRIENGTYIGFVAEHAGRVVAGAGAVLLDWGPTRGNAGATRARVVNVFTEDVWRRKGIAKALVQEVMASCARLGVHAFSLAASADASAMYTAMGFVPYSEEMIRRS